MNIEERQSRHTKCGCVIKMQFYRGSHCAKHKRDKCNCESCTSVRNWIK